MDLLQLGRKTAENTEIKGRCSGRRAARMVRNAMAEVERVRDRWANTSAASALDGAEWLLDNAYLVRREGAAAVEDLARGKRLRRAGEDSYVQKAAAVLAENAPALSPEAIAQYLSGLQETIPLTEEELSLFLPALKGELCRYLARLCSRLGGEKQEGTLAKTIGECFTGLRTLSTAHYAPILEEASAVEQLLRKDPAGVYAHMDEATRARYRTRVCQLARKRGIGEADAARRALELAQNGKENHVGWYLFHCPLGEEEKRFSGTVYVSAILMPTLCIALWMGFVLESWLLVFLLLLPLSDLIKNIVDFCVVHTVPPRLVPRMALREGIPSEGRTLCVITGLLTGEESGSAYAPLLERYRLANRDSGEELRFGLLADLPDRATPMGMEQRQWVDKARQAIAALNKTYGGGFFLFFREPVFQPRDEHYGGWERKRGALLELARLLRDTDTGLYVAEGSRQELEGTRYVITLDSDTALNVGAARELVGAMLHPLNRARIDARRNVVTQGYGLLQPRIGVELGAANRSQFSRIFAGLGGIDPYGGACSDVYHDLFDRGTYTGKGIFDVDAFVKCLDGRFPQGRILSHDLLEGAYLHAGLMEDVELTDGYPYQVTSYFSRLQRWVRGDWQLLPWLGRRVKDQMGREVENPISSVDKWKLFDNLRRSLSPVFTLIALLLGVWMSAPAFGMAAALAIVSAWSNLLLTGADLAFRGGTGLHRRYHATVIAGLGGMILQTLIQLLFLPYHAWVCASAIASALWRSIVSHKKLLEWVTAADSERKKSNMLTAFRAQWPAVAIGTFTAIFSRLPMGGAIGLVWAASPAFAWALSRPVNEEGGAPEEDHPFLLHQAGLIWRYFQDWLRPEDHWLPPDNVQERPWLGPARRTSPTNIGMALLSCIAAVDLELADKEEAVKLVGHMLDTMERLPKWNGHLYNWYDTADAAPLFPQYVSTVDSGNLRGGLIALREALYEWGEGELARRAERLSDAMDLSCLYDKERKLFYIGYDVEKEAFTSGWYDLMASEARLASYLAVALGEVESRHWRRLSRGLLGVNDYCGMASWTGTMFEYFMPNLLLPCERGSLTYESLSFCIYAQKRWGSRFGLPWGVSESGFYAFDTGMAYQYKAHGVQALGLKRGLDQDQVVAPYASFLALLLAPRSAGRNLRKLRDLGVEGKYGLFEAVDFTQSRLPAGEQWAVVGSFMVHHLGMSLVAIDNALKSNIMQERFLRDRAMGAFRELLQEKVPVGAPVMRPDRSNGTDRPRPSRPGQFLRRGVGSDFAHPACHLLWNGLISALCADSGAVRWRDDRGEEPIVSVFQERYGPGGVSFFYREEGGKLTPLTMAPLWEDGDFSWRFDGTGAQWERNDGAMKAVLRLTLPKGERGALWTVEVSGAAPGELICYLEPQLSVRADYQAHPAYSKLSLKSMAQTQGITFLRRPKKGERQAALSVQWDRLGAQWDTSRETALGRGGLRRLEQVLEKPAAGNVGAVVDPCCLVRFSNDGKSSLTLHLALAFEDGIEQAQQTAKKILTGHISESAGLEGGMRKLQFSAGEGERAMELLSALAFPHDNAHKVPQEALWPYGVSGDLPIALAYPPEEEGEADLFPLKAHTLLRQCGFAFDLVYPLTDGGSYQQPQRTELLRAIKEWKLEALLGQRGGIHLVSADQNDPLDPWQGWGVVKLWEEKQWKEGKKSSPQPPKLPCRLREGPVRYGFNEEDEFVMVLKGNLPPLGWSHLLVNGHFGWLTDETGCGHLWYGNARETPLTPWNNDPLAIGGPEWFLLTWQGETHSLFAGGDGLPVTVTYGFGWARWEKQWPGGTVRTTAFVPWDEDCRILTVECAGETGELRHIVTGRPEVNYSFAERLCLITTQTGTSRTGWNEWETKLRDTKTKWKGMVSAFQVKTPLETLNRYLNGWCLYQVIACRLLARTSHYQNGGAYGFRDQLQDTMALLPFSPKWACEQLLRCCRHQFEEGDVQHWWHEVGEEKNRGVRTRISDDLLWLPYVLSRYVKTWGEQAILKEEIPYLKGPVLKPEEAERYFIPEESERVESVYRHAVRAIQCVLMRGVGAHGLLKMGAGDWNDGMNEVGVKGRGESVWLTWFGVVVLEEFIPLAETQKDRETADLCKDWAKRLRQAAEAAWDGEWYLRGWYDNGTPLGSHISEECRIDSLPQSWAILAEGDKEKSKKALNAALEHLFDRERGIVRLFWPPFEKGKDRPGYIRGYLPGVRENGGQYTHAATWLALTCFRFGRTEEGMELLHVLLPGEKPQNVYRAEPYVLAGDVYSNPQQAGRGGWSWYTGAAGWYFQAALSGLLGISLKDGKLTIQPQFPKEWSQWTAEWKTGTGLLKITASIGEQEQMVLDGVPVKSIPLLELQGEHHLSVTVVRKN